MASHDFHRLTVAAVDPLTDDSAAVTFTVPAELRETFAFSAGQWLTVRLGEQRRSYSICAPAGGAPRIGVRVLPGGAVSGQLVHSLSAGDVLDVQAPSGTFSPDTTVAADHVLVAAGSGITPMLSIAASVLEGHPESTVTLIYGNRRSDSVMFVDDVADLKDAHPARMRLVHVLSREPQEVELFSGRLDAPKLRALLPATVDVGSVDQWWLCGPFGLVTDAVAVLEELGVDPAAVHRELFFVGEDPPQQGRPADAPVGVGAEVTVVLDGRRTVSTVAPGVTVLDGAQRNRPDLPFACKGGVCGTCRALVTEGAVTMRRNYALEAAEVEQGYVLTCQAVPTTDAVTVDFDT